MSSWCTIESDPGVFTELIQKIGVKGVQVEELYSIDAESLREFKPIYGLIFLFKWTSEKDQRTCLKAEEIPQDLFFAHQIVNNACATQAILSVLLNIDDSKVELGKELIDFKELTMMLPPDIKGEAIGESELLRVHHNSFARPEPFIMEEKKATKEDDDVFHFISYVPKDGKLYELDGLKSGPILLGDCTTANWTDKIVPHIESRIARYTTSEIKFNLLAVVGDKVQLYTEQLGELQKQYAAVPAEDVEQAEQLAKLIEEYQFKIQDEKAKQQRWKEENIRRRHNYIPFLVNLLKVLAEKKELLPLLEKGKERAQQRAAAKKEAASSSGDR